MTFDTLLARLRALARKRRLARAAAGAAATVLAVAGLLVLTFALDRWLRLPLAVRAVHLALCVAAAGWVAWRRFFRPLGERFPEAEAAMLVERADPRLEDRLISALQLREQVAAGGEVGSRELVEASIARTLADLDGRDLSAAYDARHVRKPVLGAVGAAALLVFAAAARPDDALLFAKRCLLLGSAEWPRETRLTLVVVDADTYARVVEDGREVFRVPERTPLQVRVEVEGKIPSSVELVARPTDDPTKRQMIAMGRPGGTGAFRHVFPPLSQSLVLHAIGGDDDDDEPSVEIRVARAPRLQRLQVDVSPPAYTRVAARTTADANLSVPEGTKLRFRFEVNMPLDAFELAFDKAGTLVLKPGEDGAYVHEIALAQSDFYTYRLRGKNGVNSVEAPRYVLTAEPDQAPRVQIDLPWQNAVFCTPEAVVPLRGTAIDDYGVAAVGLRFGTGDEGLPSALELTGADLLTPLGGPNVAFYRDFSPRDFGDLKVGDRARFKLLVTDNRATETSPEPHRQFGDYEYSLQVLAPADVERELAQRQARLKERVRDILALAEARAAETSELLARLGGDAQTEASLAAALAQIETGQNRITSELAGSGRQFMRVFEGYLYNRLDPGNLTEKLLAVLAGIYRSSAESDPFKIYGEALGVVRRQASETELLGRLVVILDLFVRTAAERSPEAARRLAQAGLTANVADRAETLRGAKTQQDALIEDLRALEEKLEAWEDYLDVIQGLRDLIDLQKGVKGKAEKLTK